MKFSECHGGTPKISLILITMFDNLHFFHNKQS
nr:MAG TPA: hypothetical protein [Caudoviricetes sp.]